MGWRAAQEKQTSAENRASMRHAGIKPGHDRVITPEIRTRAQNFKGRDYQQVLSGYSRSSRRELLEAEL
jgi:hypothetical protein